MEQLGINRKYEIEVEILSPLHIGAGEEWINGFDFEVDKKSHKVYSLDYINKKQWTNEYDFPTVMTKGSDLFLSKIKPFVKNQFTKRAVLCGSSIKGALRSILFQHFGGKTNKGEDVFGTTESGEEFMRFFKLSDIEFESTELVNTKIYNLFGPMPFTAGWKHGREKTDKTFNDSGFNTVYECLTPNTMPIGKASLSISTKAFYNFLKDRGMSNAGKKQIFMDEVYNANGSGIMQLFQTINDHTQSYLQKELDFFEKYNDRIEYEEKLLTFVNEMQSLRLKPNECVFKMSAGSGFHSITGDWQFGDYSISKVVSNGRGVHTSKGINVDRKESKSAKSRKIAIWNGQLCLLGFIKLRFITAKEIEDKKNAEIVSNQIKEEIMASNVGEFTPTLLKVDDIVDAYCHNKKKVRIKNENYDIQLVLPKDVDAEQLVGKSFKVKVKQISKAGKVIQVSKI